MQPCPGTVPSRRTGVVSAGQATNTFNIRMQRSVKRKINKAEGRGAQCHRGRQLGRTEVHRARLLCESMLVGGGTEPAWHEFGLEAAGRQRP